MYCSAGCCPGLSSLPISPAAARAPGPNVTVTDNGNGTVTMANGVVSILVNISGATHHRDQLHLQQRRRHTDSAIACRRQGRRRVLLGIWRLGRQSLGLFRGDQQRQICRNRSVSDSATNGLVDIHFSMLRGSPGFYVTPIWSHRAPGRRHRHGRGAGQHLHRAVFQLAERGRWVRL